MPPSVLQICWLAAIVPFWLFHVSVIVFLIRKMVTPKQSNYKAIFFKIYLMCSIYDCVVEVNMFLGLRFHLFDFVKPLYLQMSFVSTFLYVNSAYILYSQCFLHLAIAINRLFAIWMAAKVNSRNSPVATLGKYLVFLIPCLPLPILIPRFTQYALYYVGVSGELGIRYLDTNLQAVSFSSIFSSKSRLFLVLIISYGISCDCHRGSFIHL